MDWFLWNVILRFFSNRNYGSNRKIMWWYWNIHCSHWWLMGQLSLFLSLWYVVHTLYSEADLTQSWPRETLWFSRRLAYVSFRPYLLFGFPTHTILECLPILLGRRCILYTDTIFFFLLTTKDLRKVYPCESPHILLYYVQCVSLAEADVPYLFLVY